MVFHDFEVLRLILDVNLAQFKLVDEYAEEFLVLRADVFVFYFDLFLDLVHDIVFIFNEINEL